MGMSIISNSNHHTCAICATEFDHFAAEVDGHTVCADCYLRISDYAERVAGRVERLERRAEKANSEAQSAFKRSDQMASIIPMGQPILVGHHSEAADRRYRERIHALMRRGFAHQQRAQELARRANAAEKNTVISSDDPAAVLKLQAKLDAAERKQAHMKQANIEVRKALKLTESERIPALVKALGIRETDAANLLTSDYLGRFGYPDYALKNNGAEIRRLKGRLEELKVQANRAATESVQQETVGDVVIERDPAENRLRLKFPGKPDKSTIAVLKQHGFHWSPSNEAWQRQLNSSAESAAKLVLAQRSEASKPTLRTADLRTQQEYALYIGDEPAAPAPQFQLQQAVKTSFWGRYTGRVVSISQDGPRYFYEVETRSGRVVLEPEAYLTSAPELDATLPQGPTRRPLSVREIEARLDTPDCDPGSSSDHCQWNGIDQLNPDAR